MMKLDFNPLEWFARLAPREKMLILLFATILIFTVDYFLFLTPMMSEWTRINPQITEVKKKLETFQVDKEHQGNLEKELEKVQTDLKEMENRLVEKQELPALLENLSKEASASGMRITSLKPNSSMSPAAPASTASENYYELVSISISAVGGYHQFGLFLNRLENDKTKFFKMTDLEIRGNPLNAYHHEIELLLQIASSNH